MMGNAAKVGASPVEKAKRNERIAVMAHALITSPNQIVSYGKFCDLFGAAKSTISEDVSILEETLHKYGLGELSTVAGAAGGVRYRPILARKQALMFVTALAQSLSTKERLLPGGFLYLSDVLSDPALCRQMGTILAGEFYDAGADFVLTMETKGIPVALTTAEALNVPLIIARRANKIYEGSSVSIAFPTGNGGTENMSLSRRAVRTGQKALIIDDFIQKGGTASGMVALMQEFDVDVVGMGFVLSRDKQDDRLVSGAKALMTFSMNDEDEQPIVKPASWLSE
jgi:purine operon repressor